MKNNIVSIPYYSLSPNSLTLFNRVEGIPRSDRQIQTWENLEDNKNKYNELSSHSIKRLRKSISYLIYTTNEKQIHGKIQSNKVQDFETHFEKSAVHSIPIKYKLALITLTLPSVQIHTDQEIKSKLLNQFLIELKKKFGLKDYVWKAEKQENNNIHFHILINIYIHHEKIKEIWNRIVSKLGYIDTYQRNQQFYFQNGFRLSENPKDTRTESAQKAAFEKSKSENWLNPNSTDIHALYKVRNISAYLTKYLAKGVTKTDRTNEIDSIRKNILRLNSLIIEIDKKILFHDYNETDLHTLHSDISLFKNQVLEENMKLEKLLNAGISGKIWGQSTSLSKITNFVDCEPWELIPQIEEVEKHCFKKIEIPVGQSKIYSYIIDIQKFPTLNNLLKNHLEISP